MPRARRVALLVRLYPHLWREQFPDFAETLALELSARRPGTCRDVFFAAFAERLRQVGVIPKKPTDRARSGLALVYATLVPFVGLAIGMWSQLRTGLTYQRTDIQPELRTSDLLLAPGSLVVLLALALAPVLLAAETRLAGRTPTEPAIQHCRQILVPGIVLVAALLTLSVAGWAADSSRWYSPAANALPHHGPSLLATLWVRGIVASITPAWIHPSLLLRMPGGELFATLVAPVAMLTAACATFRMVLKLPSRIPGKANAALAVGILGVMLLAIAASGRWLMATSHQITVPVASPNSRIAPGHTAWVTVAFLTALASIGLVGLRRILRNRGAAPTGSERSFSYG